MKKTFAIIATLCSAVFCLAACDSDGTKQYDKLNEMLDAEYTGIVLTVTDTFDEETSLTSTYEISYAEDGTHVSYAVEQFAPLDLTAELPEDGKTVLEGEAVIKEGTVVSNSGKAEIPESALKASFTFKKEYFGNAVFTDSTFTADVSNAGAFLGYTVACSGMKVEASFSKAFTDITVTYSTDKGGNLVLSYKFTV